MGDEKPNKIDWSQYTNGDHYIDGIGKVRISGGKPIGIYHGDTLHVYPPSVFGLEEPPIDYPPFPLYGEPKDE